jgi:hypothetical protein
MAPFQEYEALNVVTEASILDDRADFDGAEEGFTSEKFGRPHRSALGPFFRGNLDKSA